MMNKVGERGWIGVYTKALCAGLDSIFDDYRRLICDIEIHLDGKELPLSSLQLICEPYYGMFMALIATVYTYASQSFPGPSVLNLLQDGINRYSGLASAACKRLFNTCYQTLWNHLAAWLQFGMLDSFNEFFITDAEYMNADLSDWFSQLSIRIDHLPSCCISYEVALNVLFIGRAIKILNPISEPSKRLIPLHDLQTLSATIKKLAESEMNSNQIKVEIRGVHRCVMAHLWNFIKDQSNLLGYISEMKNFFLLSHGDLFSLFIQETSKLMTRPPAAHAEKDINEGAFVSALQQMGLDGSESAKFRLKLHPSQLDHNYAKIKNDSAVLQLKEDLNFCGSAIFMHESIRIVSCTKSQTGAVWTSDQFQVDQGFRIAFQFSMSHFASGFAFVLQNDSPWTLGESGIGLGYSGIRACLAIEFDCHYNPKSEANEQHVSVHTNWYDRNSSNEKFAIAAFSCPSKLNDDTTRNVVIELKNGILHIKMDHTEQMDKGMKSIISVSFDIFKLRPEAGRMWFGLTGSSMCSHVTVAEDETSGIFLYSLSFQDFASEDSLSVDPWRRLGMNCKIKSPLPLIFHSQALARYDTLFRFLFTVKRVQFHLQSAWIILMQNVKFMKEMQIERLLLGLRARMQFLIDNLQFYLQVDAIEVEYTKMCIALEKATDFESGRRCHDVFLSTLIRDSFLLSKPLHRGFENIFNSCMQLCQLISKQTGAVWDTLRAKQVQQIDLVFFFVFDLMTGRIFGTIPILFIPFLVELPQV